MPKRRDVLIGVGGTLALAGCTSDESDESESTTTPTPTPTEPEPPYFEITAGDQDTFDRRFGENISLDVSVTNTGGKAGSQTVELKFNDETVAEQELELNEREEDSISYNLFAEELEADTYQYSYSTEDHEFRGGEVHILKCPEEDELPDYRAISADDLGYEDIERIQVHVRLLNDGDDYTDSDLIKIAQDVVCTLTADYPWHAIGLFYWEDGQWPGYEQAFAECNWAPDGMWSRAGDVDLGDYSTYEYSLRRIG